MTDDSVAKKSAGPSAEMAETLGLNEHHRNVLDRYKWYVAAGAVVLFLALMVFRSGSGEEEVSFRTAPVTRGDLTVTVTATGTIF